MAYTLEEEEEDDDKMMMMMMMMMMTTLAIPFPPEGVFFACFQLLRLSLNDLIQLYSWVLESVSSSNYALSLYKPSAGFTFSLVRNLTMRCATAEGTTCSLIVISTDKKQVDMHGQIDI
jgi:hypothetical protein